MIIGGSRGDIWTRIAPDFLDYLKNNYNVLIFAYFGVDGLPRTLTKVPLEYFINGINIIKKKIKVTDDDTIIIGNSKGAEASLLISKYIKARSIIACVPSCYVWQGIPSGLLDFVLPKSSWTINNRQIPFIRMKYNSKIIKDIKNKVYRTCYEKSIKDNKKSDTAIDMSSYKGKLLLLSSDIDTFWPSKEMCNKMENDFKIDITHKVLHVAGHYFQECEEAIKETIKFLELIR